MPVKKRVTKKTAAPSESPVDSEPPPIVVSDAAAATPPIQDNVIMQLPIAPNRLQEIMESTNMHGILEYSPTINDPQPYTPHNAFMCDHDMLATERQEVQNESVTDIGSSPVVADDAEASVVSKHGCICYWCCHQIPHIEFGMPIRYDVFHKSFTLFGSFCSLECAAAHNFATHMGSDRVWEIHSWIQMLAHRYGYTEQVRPAPSKYLLKMFNGPLGIDEFRQAHRGLARTYMLNVPPFIHVVSQMEVLNTSFLDTASNASPDTKKARRGRVASAVTNKTGSVFEAAA